MKTERHQGDLKLHNRLFPRGHYRDAQNEWEREVEREIEALLWKS